jgi:hypothetical protein
MRGLFSALGAVVAGACSVVGVSDTPEPPHTIVERLGENAEVRRYAPRVAAEATVPGGGRNAAFGLLFDYITGANDGGAKIAMTTPVATEEAGERIAMTAPVAEGEGFSMRFFLPEGYTAETAPAPRDERVRIVALPAREIATLRFSGSRDAATLAEKRARLEALIAASDWRATGPAQSWFYDPPWTLPPMRRNEIAIPVERASSN